MQDWVLKLVLKLIEQYITPELIAKIEKMVKEQAIEFLRELADQSDWTEIDDALVEKLAEYWHVAKG